MEQLDIKLINKIIELTKKIFKIYNNLYELEINNKKETNLYQENLNNLYLLLKIEDEYYKNIPISKIDNYIKYSDRANIFNSSTDFTLIINDFNDSFIFKRIYNRLVKIKISDKIKNYQDNNNKKIKPYYDITNIIYQTMHEDMLNSFMFEINKSYNNIDNIDYQNGLKMIKYLISFLNKNIEKKLKNNFQIENTLYITNRILSDSFNLDEDDYQDILINYYQKFINKELNRINKKNLNTTDYAFQRYRLILNTCFIKAFNNINYNNLYLKKKICDIIDMNDLDIDLDDDKNIVLIRSERLSLNGISK